VAHGSVADLQQEAGCDNFEDTFVAMAYPQGAR
jgi:hypothetical protein